MIDKYESMDVRPWERQPGEEKARYDAFCVYRDLGPDRTLELLAKVCDRKKSTLYKYSSHNNWTERVAAWDEYQDAMRREAHNEVAAGMAERHARLSLLIQEKVIMRLKTMPIERMSTRELAQLIDIAVKIERQAFGEPGAIIENQGNPLVQEIQNIYNDVKVINADPNAVDAALKAWKSVATGDGDGTPESSEHGTHVQPEAISAPPSHSPSE